MIISKKNKESVSFLGKFWCIFALLLIFSLWPNTRINILNISIHSALFLMPLILLFSLPFGSISFVGLKKYFILSLSFLSIILLSSLVNNTFDQTIFIKWVTVFVIMLLIASTIKNKNDIIAVLIAITITVTFLSVYGLIDYFNNTKFYVNPFEFATKNSLSNWTSAIFPVILFLFLFLSKKNINKIFWGVSFVTMSLSQFLTLNRSSWIIIFFSILSVFFIYKKRKKLIFCFLVFVILFCFISNINPTTIDKTVDRFKIMNDNSLLARFEQAEKTLDIIYHKPLLGIGPGNYFEHNLNTYPNNKFIIETHSVYLTILTELGIFGFMILSLMIYLILFNLKKSYHKAEKTKNRYIAIMFILSIIMILIRGLTSHEIQFIPVTPIILGLAIKFSIFINLKNKNNLQDNG